MIDPALTKPAVTRTRASRRPSCAAASTEAVPCVKAAKREAITTETAGAKDANAKAVTS